MKQIRKGVFETNSSSEHAISISQYPILIDIETYNKWKNGELVFLGDFPTSNYKFISINDFNEKEIKKEHYLTYSMYLNLIEDMPKWNDGNINEFFFKTPNGDEYVFINTAMGYDTEVYR